MENEAKFKLKKKLEEYEQRFEKLKEELIKKFSIEKYREMNVIGHKMEVLEQRIAGAWERGSSPDDIQVTSNNKPVNV